MIKNIVYPKSSWKILAIKVAHQDIVLVSVPIYEKTAWRQWWYLLYKPAQSHWKTLHML